AAGDVGGDRVVIQEIAGPQRRRKWIVPVRSACCFDPLEDGLVIDDVVTGRVLPDAAATATRAGSPEQRVVVHGATEERIAAACLQEKARAPVTGIIELG